MTDMAQPTVVRTTVFLAVCASDRNLLSEVYYICALVRSIYTPHSKTWCNFKYKTQQNKHHNNQDKVTRKGLLLVGFGPFLNNASPGYV